MTDDPSATPASDSVPEPPAAPTTPGPTAAEAWADVVTALGKLSDAVAAWTKAAADNPENRRRLDDVRNSVNEMAKQADSAFAQVTSTDFGQQVKSGAEEAGHAIGDAAQKVSEAATPHVATAFAGLASAFGRAAHKVEEAAARQKEAAGTEPAETPPEPPEPPTSNE